MKKFVARILAAVILIGSLAVSMPVHGTDNADLNDFLAIFAGSGWSMITLADYDPENDPNAEDIVLNFALSFGVYVEGRQDMLDTADFGMIAIDEEWYTHEFLSTSHVETNMYRFFGIADFEHRSIAPFVLEDDRYIVTLANGGGVEIQTSIAQLQDNQDGTLSVRLHTYHSWGDEPIGEHYSLAVVQPTADGSYHLLYWQFDAPANAQLPVREPIQDALPESTITTNTDEITVLIDGSPLIFADQPPIIIDGRTLVPLRIVFEALGFDVDWNQMQQAATLERGADQILILIGEASFITNGETTQLDVPAQIINGRTMLPLRAVLASVGYNLDWDGATRTVLITSPSQEAAPGQPTNLREFFAANDDELQEIIYEVQQETLAVATYAGIELTADIFVYGDHTLVYEFTYGPNTVFHSSVESDLDAALDDMTDFQTQMATQMRQEMEINTLYIIMRYLDSTGTTLAERTFAGH